MQNIPEKNNYQEYLELGGIINETDYISALERADNAVIDETTIAQVKIMADYAGIELQKQDNSTDRKIKLYKILRTDTRPDGVKYHHDNMSDQRIFVEALRMLGDKESVNKMIEAHPNISFKYERGDEK